MHVSLSAGVRPLGQRLRTSIRPRRVLELTQPYYNENEGKPSPLRVCQDSRIFIYCLCPELRLVWTYR